MQADHEYSSYQGTEDEENHKYSAERCLAHNVAVAHCCHGYQHEVHTLPVGERLRVAKVHEWISRVLQLTHTTPHVCICHGMASDVLICDVRICQKYLAYAIRLPELFKTLPSFTITLY